MPSVTTTTLTSITAITAISGGNVTSDGGGSITARGVCWSTNPGPTISNAKTSDGNGTGNFSSTLTALTPETKYYVRAYATNSAGTSYGNEISFTSISASGIIFNPNLTYGTLTDIDNNVYKTIQIGSQVWMAENLKTTKYKDGTSIPLVTDDATWTNLSTPGYCWYNNDAASNKNIYGALYNWYTVNTGKLCPTGWHVSSDAEWITLSNYLGGESITGVKIKETGTVHWWNPNAGATNESGFTALGSGYRHLYASFVNLGVTVSWWTTLADTANDAWDRGTSYMANYIDRSSFNKRYGFSVRCLKD